LYSDLASAIFFALSTGRRATETAARSRGCEPCHRALANDVALSNAVLVWNTLRIAEIVEAVEAASGQPVAREDLARVSPLAQRPPTR